MKVRLTYHSSCLYPLHQGARKPDGPWIAILFDIIRASCRNNKSRARLLAAGSAESSVWLKAHPVSSLRLRMSHEAIRTTMEPCLGHAHQCSQCGNDIDQFYSHGLRFQFIQGGLSHHNIVNSTFEHLVSISAPASGCDGQASSRHAPATVSASVSTGLPQAAPQFFQGSLCSVARSSG